MMDLQGRLQTTLGSGYRLERELTGGGMSRVFVASETSLGRRVVVKVLAPDVTAGVSTERFRKEIQLSASLQHPHIVSVLAAGQSEDMLYYTMPYIEGVSLRTRLTQSGELPFSDAVAVLRDVTRALAYAHRRGVAHRDIKPENILLSEDGAMVADFGVAKALSASSSGSDAGITTGIGIVLGTPSYMSPEQAAGDPMTDHRSDLYSLGILAYELLSGYAPFAGRPLQSVLAAHAGETPEPIERRRPGTPPRLAALIARCVTKRPADRPQSADEVLRELDAVAFELGLESAASGRARRLPLGAYVVAGGALVAITLGLARTFAGSSGAGALPDTRTVAVLPFANLSDNRADESFSDGMTEELIGALGKAGQLRVKSAFSLKGSQQDISDLGRQLGVQHVVAGSVRRSGDAVRIAARLVNVDDGFQVWSDTYERQLRSTADVFRVQDDISRAIVNALRLTLSLDAGAQPASVGSRRTNNLEAYRALLNGRFYVAKRNQEALRTAIRYFEDATRLDPDYAAAWNGLADASMLLNFYGFVSASEGLDRAQVAVNRALAIDSTLAEGHATLAFLRLFRSWDWDGSERSFLQSISLNPNYATAHHWYALLLLALGRHDESLRAVERALELDPVSLVVHREMGRVHYVRGDYAGAMRLYRRTLELDPTFGSVHVWIARTQIAMGQYTEAIHTLQDQADFQGGHVSGVLGHAYARAGQPEKARAILAELRARSRRENVWPINLAMVRLGLGERDQAIREIERAFQQRSPHLVYLPQDPMYRELWSDPRFLEVVRRMGLLG